MHAAHTQIHSHVQITFATLHCAHGGTSNTAAWGQKAMRNNGCHLQIRTNNRWHTKHFQRGLRNACFRQHPVLHGFSVAAVTGVHQWDLLSLLPLSYRKMWSNIFLWMKLRVKATGFCSSCTDSYQITLVIVCLFIAYLLSELTYLMFKSSKGSVSTGPTSCADSLHSYNPYCRWTDWQIVTTPRILWPSLGRVL